jgi:hypothetical protein
MLPPFIIEQIRKREEDTRRNDQRPRLELPLPMPGPQGRPSVVPDDERDRGVVILEIG